MEIGIVVLLKTIGGIRTYAESLVKTLSVIDTQNRYTVFTDDSGRFNQQERLNVVSFNIPSRYLLPWWEYVKIPMASIRRKIQLFHHTKGILPFFITCKKIVSIHDISPFLFPNTFSTFHRVYLQRNTARAVHHADCILTVSESAKRDIVNYFHVDESKIRVTYNGVSEHFKPLKDIDIMNDVRKRYGFGKKVILFVGTIQPRKNIDILIRAYHKLRKEKTD